MGLMGLAAKNMQEENRSLLQKSEAFSDLAKNKFINAPNLKYKATRADFQQLRNIKIEKSIQSKRQSVMIKLSIICLLISVILSAWIIA